MDSSRKMLLVIIAVVFSLYTKANIVSNDTLPSLESLEASIIAYSTQECEAEITAYKTSEPKPWKELIPTIGFGYTAVGSLRPSVMWSPSQIFDRKERHNRNKNQKASLELSCEMILADRLHRIRQLYRNYQVDQRIIESRRSTLLIDEELFAISERKYQEHLIKPSVYLAAKRAIVQARSDVQMMEMELEKLGHEIRYEAKWSKY